MNSLCFVPEATDIETFIDESKSCVGQIDLIELNIDKIALDQWHSAVSIPVRLSEIFGTDFPIILSSFHTAANENILKSLVQYGGWSYLDVEWDKSLPDLVRTARRAGIRIIRSRIEKSSTLLDKPVEEIADIVRRMAEPIDETVTIPRLVVPCNSSRHLLVLAKLATALSDLPEKLITAGGSFADYGGPTVILTERFGSLWTYATGLDNLIPSMYRFRDISSQTPVYGVTGNPVAHSRSPELHNGWLRNLNIPGTYLPLRSDDLAVLLETCDILGISGLSVTVPHKVRALELSEDADSLTRKIGAANTLIRGKNGWKALNTDATGFLIPLLNALNLKSPEDLNGKQILIIGAGGAAKAVVHSLESAGAALIILNRTVERADALASSVKNCVSGPLTPDSLPLLDDVVIAVQTTTVGMSPNTDADPIPWWQPKKCSLVYDLIYKPEETKLLKRMKAIGTATMNGASMLRVQAALQFKHFTGVKPLEP